MTKQKQSEKINAWKSLAELFLKLDKKVYIKDYNDQYYFANILLVGENTLLIECFAPLDKKDKKFNLYWVSINKFEEYQEFKKADEVQNEY